MINVGILGLSDFAIKKMVPALMNSAEFTLFGIASSSECKARVFAHSNNCLYFKSYLDLCMSPEIDLIYIPLPNSLHFYWAKKALCLSKHVLVEKPVSLSYEQVKYLVDLASQKKKLLSENFLFLYHLQADWFRSNLDGPIVGKVLRLKSQFFIPARSPQDIRYKQHLGGGALNDLGCYMTKLLTYMYGENNRLIKSKITMSQKYNVDISGSAHYLINDSIAADFSWGFDSNYECSFLVEGSKSSILTNRFFTLPPSDPVVIYQNNCELLSLRNDDQYSNKWQSLAEMIFDQKKIDTHLQSILLQSKKLQVLRDCSEVLWQ